MTSVDPLGDTRRRRRWAAIATTLLTLATATACGPSDELEGSVRITGSSTLRPIMSTVSGKFATSQPLVRFTIDGPGTADGFTLFCDGLADITGASRRMNERERSNCASSGIDYVELTVGTDVIVLLTNVDNPVVECLTVDQLYALAGPEAQGVDRWIEADPTLPDAPFVLIGPGRESGTRATFIDLALTNRAKARGKAAALRSDAQVRESDSLIVAEVNRTPGSLAYVGYSGVAERTDQVATVALDGGNGCRTASAETAANGTYPLTRKLYVYARLVDGAPSPVVGGLIDFLLTDEGLAVAQSAGGLQLTPAEADATRQRWAEVR
jgi:phosphate transport system substrate-binding protein